MAEAGEEGRSEGDLGAELSLADASGSRAEEGGVGERIRGLQFSSDEEDDDDDEGGRGRRRDSDGGADEELDGAPVIGADEEERDGDGEVDSDMDVGGTPDCPVETDKAADSRSVGSQTDSTRGTVSSSGDPQGSPVADMKMTDAEDPVAVLPAPLSDATDPDAAVPPSESQESSRQGGDTPEIRGTSEEGVCIFPPVDIKDEPVDEEYDRALAPQPPAPPRRIKDEPEELVQPQKSSEELRISSVFSVGGNATPPAAPVAAPLPSQSGCARASAAPPRAPPPGPPPESTPPPSGGGGVVRVSCSGCTKVLQKGQTAFQRKGSSQLYCSTVCLTAGYALPASGKPLYPCKTCHSCLKDIPNPKDVITAPLDGDGTMRDFCSQGCLSAFKVKRGSGANANTSSRGSSGSSHMPSAGSASPATDTIKCSVCRMIALVNHEVNYQGTVHKICSDACFARFRSSNNLAMNCCESCGSYCYSGPGQCHLLTIEGATRKFCSQPCLTAYKQKYGRAIPCAGCQTLCPADEAVDGVGSDGKILLYCSAACVGNANGAPNSSFAGRFNMAKKYLTAQELFALIESGDIGVLDDDEGQQEEEEEIEALNDGSFMIELVTGNANDSIEVDPTADDSCLTAADDDDPRDPDYEASEEDNDTDSDDDGTAESTGNTPKSKDTSHNNPANGTIRAVPAGNNDRNPANETVLQLFPVADAPPPKVGKKRVRNPDLWKKNVATKKRNAGLAYINTSGKLVGPAKMGPPCRCKKNCWERLGDETEIAFKSFWGLGDKNLQDSLLFHGMVCSPVKRRRPKTGEREDTNLQRNYSFKYMIKRSDGMFEEEVCQRAFRSVYGIGSKRFERIRDSAKGCNTSPKDKRGAHGKQPRISEFTKNRVREHIKSFPTRSSHYSRQKNRERKYLHESLNERRMWFLYLHRYEPDELEKIRRKEKANPEVKYWLYCDIFNHEFSLSFGLPRSDTCNMCDRLREDIEKAQKTGNEAKEKELKAQLEFHHRNAEKGYSTLNHMEERAQRGEIDMLTFAFEQNLPSPTLKNSDMFYARLLWTYNFGIHNCGDNTGCMHIWSESEAKRGASEVCSCFNHYLLSHPSKTRHLVLFSDGCGGQNRNKVMLAYLLHLIKCGRFDRIDHFLLTRGHTVLPNDGDFGIIEKYKRGEMAFVPKDYIDIIREARTSQPFEVVYMQTNDIIDYMAFSKQALKTSMLTDTVTKKTVEMTSIMWFSYGQSEVLNAEDGMAELQDHPDEIWGRCTLTEIESWMVFKPQKRNANLAMEFTNHRYEDNSVTIKYAKYKDLQDKVVSLGILPEENREFYVNLRHDGPQAPAPPPRHGEGSDSDSDADDYNYD